MSEQFVYAVTPSPGLGEARFENLFVHNVSGAQNDLAKVAPPNGHATDYLWLVGTDASAAEARPPDLSRLAEKLGSLGTVTPWLGSFAFVDVDFARKRASVSPNLVEVSEGERMIWFFHDVPPGYQPWIDFFSFQAKGSEVVDDGFEPPFEEVTSAKTLIVGAGAGGAEGRYRYEVALVPGRRTKRQRIVRLECHPWLDGDAAAAIEISDPPAK